MENNTNCSQVDCNNNVDKMCISDTCLYNFDIEKKDKYPYSYVVITKKCKIIVNTINASSESKAKRSLRYLYPGCTIEKIHRADNQKAGKG